MELSTNMLAPCGMNCAVCYAHLRKKKTCPGCRGQEDSQPNFCRRCTIRNCAVSSENYFCFECLSFPCQAIKRIDKRYRRSYQVSFIENAARMKTVGAGQFMLEDIQKWTCTQCGGLISLHSRLCSRCGSQKEGIDEKI